MIFRVDPAILLQTATAVAVTAVEKADEGEILFSLFACFFYFSCFIDIYASNHLIFVIIRLIFQTGKFGKLVDSIKTNFLERYVYLQLSHVFVYSMNLLVLSCFL